MSKLIINQTKNVDAVFEAYPGFVKGKMLELRELVKEVAEEIDEISIIEETLKWGEPSYLAKKGSTLRMDWKEKNPNQYALYFKCTSRLVPTFRLLFEDKLKFETTRAIVFDLEEEIPRLILKKCIKATLTYHSVKTKPQLGIE